MVAHEETRRIRMHKIKATLDKAKAQNKIIDNEKLIAECCMEWGCMPRTVKDYLKIVRLANG